MADLAGLIDRLEKLDGRERDEAIDTELQVLWDGGDDKSFGVEIGNEYHEKPVPFTDDLSCAMALAVRLIDNGSTDIEVAHRSVGGKAFGRAYICGPHVESSAKAATPALALLIALLRAMQKDGQ